MLKVNTTLTSLDLSWNAIRLESAVALALSLEINSTLQTLLLGNDKKFEFYKLN